MALEGEAATILKRRDERRKFLGDDYVKVDEGKWRSLDGKRENDYLGKHNIGPGTPNTPHVHFEFLEPKLDSNGKPTGNFTTKKNVHIPLAKKCK